MYSWRIALLLKRLMVVQELDETKATIIVSIIIKK
ncbi:hypothetical protein HNR31_000255 [Anoxybacillus caldiproteolyticus]|uniref:Uncharacterized protein n=1 Tax=Thermaerobacillus caldiproteolyticus TaxID=247480 RepID=A0A7W0BX09_9BACL|nr:hypothetical protein [Anoxybacillus caldiproteolyticus]